MFTKQQLYKLIIPLIIEQILAVTVGLVGMIMVAGAGEAAVSGVSIVDTINILLISIFTALATGGAVVSAQYLGHKELDKACRAADQLLLISEVIALILMILSLLGNEFILKLIYGDINEEIMHNARIYFYLTAISFPFLAIYNSCAALFRAMGNSRISMTASLIMNLINILSNAILVIGYHMGVAGVGISTLLSRVIAAMIMLFLIQKRTYPIYIENIFHLGYNGTMIKRILNIGIPNGLENSIFQIGKILVQGLIASFGTYAIAANAVANTITNFEVIPGSAIGLAMITIVGQCVGANDYQQAKKYTIKLMKLAYLIMFFLNIAIILFMNPIVGIYHLSAHTTAVTIQLLLYHSICCAIIWPAAFTLPCALRASNDVKFTMLTSIASMWIFRIALSYVLGRYLGLGVLGVWIAMTVDWLFRAISFIIRFIKGKWKLHVFVA